MRSRVADRRISTLRPAVERIDTRIAQPAEKRADPIYLSPEWRELLRSIIDRRGRVCENRACKTPPSRFDRIYGDHIVELRDGGAALDEQNVQLLCATCHAKKTAIERSRRLGATVIGQ